MKLIFENWRKHLKEAGPVDSRAESVLKWAEGDTDVKTKVAKPKASEVEPDEYASPYEQIPLTTREKYFGDNPDELQCVIDLRDSRVGVEEREFKDCMWENGYRMLGAGSFRSVFTIPDNPELVLKIVGADYDAQHAAARAKEMNRKEAQGAFQTTSDLVPKVYDSANDHFWIISEKVTPITSWRETKTFFPAWSAEDQEDFNFYFHKLISEDRDEEDLINTLDNRIEYVKLGEELVNDPLILQIRDLLAQFDLPAWDIRPHNVGYTTRDGKKQFVILDPGFELTKLTKDSQEEQPEDSAEFENLFKNKDVVTAKGKPNIMENWQKLIKELRYPKHLKKL